MRVCAMGLVFLMLLSSIACVTQRSAFRMEEWFVFGGVAVQHHEYLLQSRVASGQEPRAAVREGLICLRSPSRVEADMLASWYGEVGPLRNKDALALAISSAAGQTLHLYTHDNVETRDEKIARFVASFDTSTE